MSKEIIECLTCYNCGKELFKKGLDYNTYPLERKDINICHDCYWEWYVK